MSVPNDNPFRMMIVLAIAANMMIAGCDSTDQRLVQQAETASQRQADQNRQIAHQNHQIAEATNRLVEADAQARKETLSLQRDLQKGHNELEGERRELAARRHSEPIIAAVLTNVGLALTCLLPLVLCWYLLHGLRQEPADTELSDLLVSELVAESPLLLPPLSANPVPVSDRASRAALPHGSPAAANDHASDDWQSGQEPIP